MAEENTLEIIARLQADASSFAGNINRAREELQKLGGAASGVGREVDRGVDGAGDAIEDLGRAADKTGEKIEGVGKKSKDGFRDVEDGAEGAGRGIGGMDSKALAFIGRFAGPAALGAAALKFFRDLNEEVRRGQEALESMIESTQRLIQISPSPADLARVEDDALEVVKRSTMSLPDAQQYVFDVESQLRGRLGEEGARKAARDFGETDWFMDAGVMPGAYGTYLGNYGTEQLGDARQFTNKMITASTSSAVPIEGMATAAQGSLLGEYAGVSFDEQLGSAAALVGSYGGSMEQVGTGQKALAALSQREGVKSEDGTFEGLLVAWDKRDAEIKRNMAAVNGQTAALERQAKALEAQQKQIEATAQQVKRQREDADLRRKGDLPEAERRKRLQENRQLEDAAQANRERQAALRTQQRGLGKGKEQRKTLEELLTAEREAGVFVMRARQSLPQIRDLGAEITAAGQADPENDALAQRRETERSSDIMIPQRLKAAQNYKTALESKTHAVKTKNLADLRQVTSEIEALERTEANITEWDNQPTVYGDQDAALSPMPWSPQAKRWGAKKVESAKRGKLPFTDTHVFDQEPYGSTLTPASADCFRDTDDMFLNPDDWRRAAPGERSSADQLVLGRRAYPTQGGDATNQNIVVHQTVNVGTIASSMDAERLFDEVGRSVARNQ